MKSLLILCLVFAATWFLAVVPTFGWPVSMLSTATQASRLEEGGNWPVPAPSEEPDGDRGGPDERRSAEWDWLVTTSGDLQRSRRLLVSGSLSAALYEQLDLATTELAEAFLERLTDFINDSPDSDPPSPELKAALGWYVSEARSIAEEYIDVGGDYSRAIQIYEECLELLPEHEGLAEALSWAREHQYLDLERFARATAGMTFEEVREVWGPVNLRRIREYEGRPGVAAWFYPTSADGGTAVVVFRDGVAIGAAFDLSGDQEDEGWGEVGEVRGVTDTR